MWWWKKFNWRRWTILLPPQMYICRCLIGASSRRVASIAACPASGDAWAQQTLGGLVWLACKHGCCCQSSEGRRKNYGAANKNVNQSLARGRAETEASLADSKTEFHVFSSPIELRLFVCLRSLTIAPCSRAWHVRLPGPQTPQTHPKKNAGDPTSCN